MSELAGKVALVTGASRGIGEATARLLAERGAAVMLVSRSEAALARVSSSIKDAGGESSYIVADISREAEVAAAFSHTHCTLGAVDVLVNNAGVIACAPIYELSTVMWDDVMAVNLRGAFLCIREAFHHMRSKGGAIVNISSLAGIRGTEKFPGYSAYTASKHGIIGLTESLSVEGKPHGIRVNAIAPGAVDTEMMRKAAPHLRTSTSPVDIARLVLFLADEGQSRSLNGSILEVHCNL